MKKILLGLIALTGPLLCAAQISLEHTYSSTIYTYTTLLSANGEKYYTFDSTAVYVYNMDHTLWKTMHPNSYAGYKFTGPQVVSDHLFNSDDAVEYVALYTAHTGGTYRAEVVNEAGAVLQDLGGALGADAHYNSVNDNYKLFAYTGFYSSLPYYYTTDVYSVPGTLPCGVCGKLGADKVTRSGSNLTVSAPSPNPSSDAARISYILPSNVAMGVLTFYNPLGETVKQMPVLAQPPYIDVNTSTFKPGTYLYNISADGITSTTQTLIVK